jgi:hypothetical protein
MRDARGGGGGAVTAGGPRRRRIDRLVLASVHGGKSTHEIAEGFKRLRLTPAERRYAERESVKIGGRARARHLIDLYERDPSPPEKKRWWQDDASVAHGLQRALEEVGLGGAAHPVRRLHHLGGSMEFPAGMHSPEEVRLLREARGPREPTERTRGLFLGSVRREKRWRLSDEEMGRRRREETQHGLRKGASPERREFEKREHKRLVREEKRQPGEKFTDYLERLSPTPGTRAYYEKDPWPNSATYMPMSERRAIVAAHFAPKLAKGVAVGLLAAGVVKAPHGDDDPDREYRQSPEWGYRKDIFYLRRTGQISEARLESMLSWANFEAHPYDYAPWRKKLRSRYRLPPLKAKAATK